MSRFYAAELNNDSDSDIADDSSVEEIPELEYDDDTLPGLERVVMETMSIMDYLASLDVPLASYQPRVAAPAAPAAPVIAFVATAATAWGQTLEECNVCMNASPDAFHVQFQCAHCMCVMCARQHLKPRAPRCHMCRALISSCTGEEWAIHIAQSEMDMRVRTPSPDIMSVVD